MDSVLTRKIGPGERYSIFNGLASVPVLLIGKSTLIDLLNDTSVAGIIDDVDGYMNITMVKVVFIDQRLQQHAFDTFHVQARNIRVLHIPESIKLEPAMRTLFDRFSGGRNEKKNKSKVHTFKLKRAQLRQQETLRELATAAGKEQHQQQQPVAGPSNK